jgi:hypothetical protein
VDREKSSDQPVIGDGLNVDPHTTIGRNNHFPPKNESLISFRPSAAPVGGCLRRSGNASAGMSPDCDAEFLCPATIWALILQPQLSFDCPPDISPLLAWELHALTMAQIALHPAAPRLPFPNCACRRYIPTAALW